MEKFIQKAHQIAKKSIQKRKKVLRFLAKTLIEKETIEKEEFDQIIRKFKVKPERIKV